MDKEVLKIPELKATVEEVTIKALEQIKDAEKEGIIKKQEIIRDVALSVVGKLQSLWDKIALIESDEQTLRKYSYWFVAPLAEIMDLARKANVNLYEMRYGKKINIERKEMKFEDFIKSLKAQVMARPENQIIDITVENGRDNDK